MYIIIQLVLNPIHPEFEMNVGHSVQVLVEALYTHRGPDL